MEWTKKLKMLTKTCCFLLAKLFTMVSVYSKNKAAPKYRPQNKSGSSTKLECFNWVVVNWTLGKCQQNNYRYLQTASIHPIRCWWYKVLPLNAARKANWAHSPNQQKTVKMHAEIFGLERVFWFFRFLLDTKWGPFGQNIIALFLDSQLVIVKICNYFWLFCKKIFDYDLVNENNLFFSQILKKEKKIANRILRWFFMKI